MLKWPGAGAVEAAVRQWARSRAVEQPEIRRVGYFGSYARGTGGVGSDVDILVVVAGSDRPFSERAAGFGREGLPVPADILVYTADEWAALEQRHDPFARRLAREVRWVHEADGRAHRLGGSPSWLRFCPDWPLQFAALVERDLPRVVLMQGACFLGFNLYRGIWRYASLPALKRLILTAAVVTPVALLLAMPGVIMPCSVLVLDLLLGIMGGSRLA